MKRFNFPLQKILEFREQLFKNEQSKFKKINLEILELEEKKLAFLSELGELKRQFEIKMELGFSSVEYGTYQNYVQNIFNKIDGVDLDIADANKRRENQLKIVIKANQDVLMLEKLKDKKLDEYNVLSTKKEEQFIEEFVNNLKFTT